MVWWNKKHSLTHKIFGLIILPEIKNTSLKELEREH
jgi:hypothetical protein